RPDHEGHPGVDPEEAGAGAVHRRGGGFARRHAAAGLRRRGPDRRQAPRASPRADARLEHLRGLSDPHDAAGAGRPRPHPRQEDRAALRPALHRSPAQPPGADQPLLRPPAPQQRAGDRPPAGRAAGAAASVRGAGARKGIPPGPMRIGLVVQRFGQDVIGGAELHARWIAQHLAERHRVEVLTTCALDYITWENAYEPGETTVAGLPVRRFPVARRRTPEGFDDLSSKVHFFDHSDDEERRWMEEHGPVTPELLDHLGAHHPDYDALLFFSYRYWTTYHGLAVAPQKSLLVATA